MSLYQCKNPMLLSFLSVIIVVVFATVVIAIVIIIIFVIGSVVSCTNSQFNNSLSPQVKLVTTAFCNSSPIHSVTTLVTRVIWKLHLLLFYSTEMATHDKMSSFDPNKEQWTLYTKRLDFYFETNNITSAETKRAIFLTVCIPSTFQLVWYNLAL